MKKNVLKSKFETGNHSNTESRKSRMCGGLPKLCVLLLTVILSVTGCNKNKDDNPPDATNEKMERAYQEIKPTADSILLSEDPVSGFEAIAEEYRKMEEVKEVVVSKDALTVVLKNGFICVWKIDYLSKDKIPLANTRLSEIFKERAITKSTQRKFCIINQVSDNERFNNLLPQCDELSSLYSNDEWKTTVIPRALATKDFFISSLNQYDAIYILTHGSIHNDRIYLAAGDFYDSQRANIFNEAEKKGKIDGTVLMNLKETRNGKEIGW